ncbi:unannotated protein [freshwater metagenome]|uniref:Unannotated protein n=1 Tax=freshwater metagenome TaxID=449393 RepID=A0A6J7D282_9ZZZZ|nr:YbgC/FadM family acyl-CoA thioesterase [Actinomycetota bacterium]
MAPLRWTFRVRYHECDPQGIVFNAHYVTYFDMTVAEMMREAFPEGGYFGMIETHGVDFVVAELNVRFLASARYDDELELAAEITAVGTTSMQIKVTASRAGELLAEGALRYVWVDAKTWKKTPIPETVLAALEPFRGA